MVNPYKTIILLKGANFLVPYMGGCRVGTGGPPWVHLLIDGGSNNPFPTKCFSSVPTGTEYEISYVQHGSCI